MSTHRYCACPYCEAIFRLPDSKFKRSAGIVRCGACREVFDSGQNLVIRSGGRFVPVPTIFDTTDISTKKILSGKVSSPEQKQAEPEPEPEPKFENQASEPEKEKYDSELAVTHFPDPDLDFSAPSYSWQQDEDDDDFFRNTHLDDIKNPFDDGEPENPDQSRVQEKRSEPVFSPLNLDETSEQQQKEEDSEISEGHRFTNEPVFSDSEHYVDDFDSELNVKLVTAGVAANGTAWQDEDSFLDSGTGEESQLSSLSRNGVDKFIADRKNPVSSVMWFLVTAAFVVLLGAQIKYFFVEKYAQDATLRPYLTAFCKVADCVLPPRKDPFKFTLTHTKIDLHPGHPGAIRVTVKLINEAEFSQPYPNLQLTLTDRVGRVVGRRTFTPELYLDSSPNRMLGQGELASILFDLARPHEKAVGFVIDIVTDSSST